MPSSDRQKRPAFQIIRRTIDLNIAVHTAALPSAVRAGKGGVCRLTRCGDLQVQRAKKGIGRSHSPAHFL
jgi:hypothetical protein